MTIRDFLHDQGIRFDFFLHRPAPSSTHLAGHLHVPGRTIAKAVLVRAEGRLILAVLPATHRIDPPRLAEIVGVADLAIATESEVLDHFHDCEPGAVPPFGRAYGLETIVDASLAAGSEIVFVGNNRHEGFRMRYRDYEAVERPIRARFARPIATRRARAHRSAG